MSLRDQVAGLADQFRVTPELHGSKPVPPRRAWLVGVGGSGMAGEFLAHAVHPGIQAVPWRDAHLPPWLERGDLVLCISYSGLTQETLDVWHAAGEAGALRAAVASGGTLGDEAAGLGVPWGRVPAGLAPRCALGYLVRAGWELLCPGQSFPWDDTARHVATVASRWSGGQAQGWVSERGGRIPALLASRGPWVAAARRWTGELAENAKQGALLWALPEASHNAIMTVASEAPKPVPFWPLALGKPRHPADLRRWEATLAAVASAGSPVTEIHEPHAQAWIEAVGLAHAGSWASLALAEATGTDPESLSLMNDLKRRLARGKEGNAP